VILVE